MNKAEAVQLLEKCRPIYQKLLTLTRYELTAEEKACLAEVDHLAISHLVDKD